MATKHSADDNGQGLFDSQFHEDYMTPRLTKFTKLPKPRFRICFRSGYHSAWVILYPCNQMASSVVTEIRKEVRKQFPTAVQLFRPMGEGRFGQYDARYSLYLAL